MKQLLLIAPLACALISASAQGTFQFRTTMSGANEVPPNSKKLVNP